MYVHIFILNDFSLKIVMVIQPSYKDISAYKDISVLFWMIKVFSKTSKYRPLI